MDKIKYLLKFGEHEHIKAFAAGNLYCSDAVTFWGIEDKLKIKGQGDVLEAGAKIFSQHMSITDNETNITTIINARCNSLVHIDPAKHIPVFCMFAVGENDCTIDENGNSKIQFSDKTKATIQEHFPKADSVAIVKNPDAFIHDIESTIGCKIKCEKVHYFHIDKGLPVHDGKDTAIDMEYMKYLMQDTPPKIEKGKTTYSFSADFAYRVLFCKDIFFKDEQEYRIILPTETISKGTNYPITVNETIEVIALKDFLR